MKEKYFLISCFRELKMIVHEYDKLDKQLIGICRIYFQFNHYFRQNRCKPQEAQALENWM